MGVSTIQLELTQKNYIDEMRIPHQWDPSYAAPIQSKIKVGLVHILETLNQLSI